MEQARASAGASRKRINGKSRVFMRQAGLRSREGVGFIEQARHGSVNGKGNRRAEKRELPGHGAGSSQPGSIGCTTSEKRRREPGRWPVLSTRKAALWRET